MRKRITLLVIRLHRRFCRPRYIPIVWTLMIVTMILQVVLVALARP